MGGPSGSGRPAQGGPHIDLSDEPLWLGHARRLGRS